MLLVKIVMIFVSSSEIFWSFDFFPRFFLSLVRKTFDVKVENNKCSLARTHAKGNYFQLEILDTKAPMLLAVDLSYVWF